MYTWVGETPTQERFKMNSKNVAQPFMIDMIAEGQVAVSRNQLLDIEYFDKCMKEMEYCNVGTGRIFGGFPTARHAGIFRSRVHSLYKGKFGVYLRDRDGNVVSSKDNNFKNPVVHVIRKEF